MLQKHIIKVTKKLIDFVRYLLEHKDNNNFYTKAEADCYQRFINSVTQKNINEMLHYLRQYGGDLKNYYTVPNYFLVDYSFYPGWSLFYFDKQFNPDLLKFFGIDLNEFKYLFSKYEELSDTDQTRRYRQKKFLAFCFALSWVEAVKILAYEENNQKAKEYLNLIEFREFCSNDKSAGNLFNKLVERVKAQNIPANYLDASYCPTSIRFDRYMYFIDNSIIITREDNNPKQGNKKANKAGLTQSPAPAPAVVDNVMTLEPYDENFTAFTGDFSDLDISASLNDWEAGGYSEPENKNKITAINDNVDDFYFKYVNWDLFNKSVNIFRPFWEKSNKISALDSGRRLYETFTELFKYVFQAFTAFANIKGVNFWDIFAEIAHIYDNDNTDISAIANLYGINLFKIYDKMYKFKPEHEIHNFKDMLNYHSYDENNVIKFKICNILANIWMYYINHAELHKDINFISEPLEIEKVPKEWEKIARLCAIAKEHEIFSEKIKACEFFKKAYKWDGTYLLIKDISTLNNVDITMTHNLMKQYYNVCDHFDQNKDRWIIENKINLRYLYEKSIHNEKDIILFFGPYLYADQKITNLRNLCKNVLALDCKGLKSKDDYLNMLENILKGFKHPHKENIKFNLDDLRDVKEPENNTPDWNLFKKGVHALLRYVVLNRVIDEWEGSYTSHILEYVKPNEVYEPVNDYEREKLEKFFKKFGYNHENMIEFTHKTKFDPENNFNSVAENAVILSEVVGVENEEEIKRNWNKLNIIELAKTPFYKFPEHDISVNWQDLFNKFQDIMEIWQNYRKGLLSEDDVNVAEALKYKKLFETHGGNNIKSFKEFAEFLGIDTKNYKSKHEYKYAFYKIAYDSNEVYKKQ